MGAKTLLILKPHLDWITTSSVNDFYENMLWILCTLWVFVCNFVLCSVRLLIRHVSSIEVSNGEIDCTVVKTREDVQLGTRNSENNGIEEKEDDRGDEDDRNVKEEVREDSDFLESSSAARANKCQFTSSKGISGFIEEPTWMRFSFQEFYVGQNVATISDNRNFVTGAVEDQDIPRIRLEEAAVDHVKEYGFDQLQTTLNEEFVSDDVGAEMKTFLQHTSSDPGDFDSKVDSLASDNSINSEDHSFEAGAIVFIDSSLDSEANSESAYPIPFTQGSSDKVYNSTEFEFQSEQIGVAEGLGSEEEVPSRETVIPDFKDQNFDYDDEYIAFKPGEVDARMKGKHNMPELPDLYRVVSGETEDIEEQENPVPDPDYGFSKPNFDEQGELEDEWEHEDIIEQLKLELRNARTGGLPTILEEENEGEDEAESSESPAQVVEVLNTMTTNQKIEYKDRVSEIQKFYKSYAEKMRKLDVLNFQTMHAIGLIQFKDPVKIISIGKAGAPVSKSPISQNIWPRKAWKNTEDPILKFVGELHRDLGLVYVGQVCLSWEILRWQYEKVCELKEHDSQGCHRYNQVAGEFQLFQVLLQRFIENQQFQGPRIRNYVKNRCIIRSLLQVPAVKDDNVNDKNMQSGNEEDAISCERLREIIEESMHIFWNFLRTDKFTQRNALTNLRDPALSEIFIGIQTTLQKKERKLKDITRSGNCIVKRFQKHTKGQHDHGQLLAQVQLKLISRVLNMPKLTTDQLIWCREKLEQTSISRKKKIQVEPSFSLFPC